MLKKSFLNRNSNVRCTAATFGRAAIIGAVVSFGGGQAAEALGVSVGVAGVNANVSVGTGGGNVSASATVGVGSSGGTSGNIATASVGIGSSGGSSGSGASVDVSLGAGESGGGTVAVDIGGNPGGSGPGGGVGKGGTKLVSARGQSSVAAPVGGARRCVGQGTNRGNLTSYTNYELHDRKGSLVGWVADMTVSDQMKVEKVRFMGVDKSCYSVSGVTFSISGRAVRMN